MKSRSPSLPIWHSHITPIDQDRGTSNDTLLTFTLQLILSFKFLFNKYNTLLKHHVIWQVASHTLGKQLHL